MSFPFASTAAGPESPAKTGPRKIALICSKGGLDECYPVLIMANAARMTGIECSIFFTFYGLDVVTRSRVENLHVSMVANPTSPITPMLAGLPGMSHLTTHFMKNKLDELDVPQPREMITLLADSGCQLYGCELALKMFDRTEDDLLPEVSEVITATDFFVKTEGADIIFV